MARGRLRMPRGRLRMPRGRLRMARVSQNGSSTDGRGRLRMARRRPAADGPPSSGCGWPAVVVRLRMARGLAVPLSRRRKMGEIRVVRGWLGFPTWSATCPLVVR